MNSSRSSAAVPAPQPGLRRWGLNAPAFGVTIYAIGGGIPMAGEDRCTYPRVDADISVEV
jgi:hypothetical protein